MNNQISKEEYSNACTEVLAILNFVKEEDVQKIPKEEIENLKKNANLEYTFSYDVTKNIKEQNVSKVAKGIIANFFIKYIATSDEKQKIRMLQHKNKEEKIEANNTLKVEKQDIDTEIPKIQIRDLVEVKEEKWYEKVYKFLKSIFKNNKR